MEAISDTSLERILADESLESPMLADVGAAADSNSEIASSSPANLLENLDDPGTSTEPTAANLDDDIRQLVGDLTTKSDSAPENDNDNYILSDLTPIEFPVAPLDDKTSALDDDDDKTDDKNTDDNKSLIAEKWSVQQQRLTEEFADAVVDHSKNKKKEKADFAEKPKNKKPASSSSAPSTPRRRRTGQGMFTEDELENFFEPLRNGWRRELHYRKTKLSADADVYYFAPKGPRLRSLTNILDYLKKIGDDEYNEKNFTFRKVLLGFNEIIDAEIVKNAEFAGDSSAAPEISAGRKRTATGGSNADAPHAKKPKHSPKESKHSKDRSSHTPSTSSPKTTVSKSSTPGHYESHKKSKMKTVDDANNDESSTPLSKLTRWPPKENEGSSKKSRMVLSSSSDDDEATAPVEKKKKSSVGNEVSKNKSKIPVLASAGDQKNKLPPSQKPGPASSKIAKKKTSPKGENGESKPSSTGQLEILKKKAITQSKKDRLVGAEEKAEEIADSKKPKPAPEEPQKSVSMPLRRNKARKTIAMQQRKNGNGPSQADGQSPPENGTDATSEKQEEQNHAAAPDQDAAGPEGEKNTVTKQNSTQDELGILNALNDLAADEVETARADAITMDANGPNLNDSTTDAGSLDGTVVKPLRIDEDRPSSAATGTFTPMVNDSPTKVEFIKSSFNIIRFNSYISGLKNVFESLDNRDLANARLVCKAWDVVASPVLDRRRIKHSAVQNGTE